MCLIAFAVQPDERTTLLLAANRDEFHRRPATALNWWAQPEGIAGGRDLEAGGSWLAASRNGRFATVTNSRDAQVSSATLESRGRLVVDFLLADTEPLTHVSGLGGDRYAGFNLLVATAESVAYASNRGAGPQALAAGVYGLSNATLNTPWPKSERSRRRLGELLGDGEPDDDALFELLGDRERAPIEQVDAAHLPPSMAHRLSSPFIVGDDYGTRCSTIVRLFRSGRIRMTERRYAPDGRITGMSHVDIRPD